MFKILTPKEVIGKKLIRFGNKNNDGGYVIVEDFNISKIAYSFGISDEFSWDIEIASKGIDVYMYDHTINGINIKSNKLHFFKYGICGINNNNKNLKTLIEFLHENGHIKKKI